MLARFSAGPNIRAAFRTAAYSSIDSVAWGCAVMGESFARRRRMSKRLREENFPISLFGRCVVIAARGVKPGDWLAARIREQGGKCTERNANLIIAGKQKPNVYAMHALNGALLADRMP